MNIETVNELIASLESAGELSIRETKVMALAKAYQQLAAENVALKQYALDCVNAVENWNSWADKEDQIHNDIETPATDRIVSGIKADGVEEFIGRLQQHVDEGDFVGDEVDVIVGAIDCGKEFCEQLREGADK
ncbi:hypothetical protein MBR92_001337 [Klebsiella pneumoniae]|nr:hypothetical protein [Klebsiella pneumoniae]EKX1393180.1 hypothetical protein [Klebsiella pneumoniae]EKX3339600.1 hypothetical protein [Klebsiella pneumoniae]EKX3639941.1 hypothetical protein [Klebsiella pneumoniae]